MVQPQTTLYDSFGSSLGVDQNSVGDGGIEHGRSPPHFSIEKVFPSLVPRAAQIKL